MGESPTQNSLCPEVNFLYHAAKPMGHQSKLIRLASRDENGHRKRQRELLPNPLRRDRFISVFLQLGLHS
jgi:hypothetical protein